MSLTIHLSHLYLRHIKTGEMKMKYDYQETTKDLLKRIDIHTKIWQPQH